ncbi:hypothetical protein BTO30_16165 [Domibacillus antri]|uniref:DUF4268 domain-containing protein n=1 Tax=Domibacillus antri TaxID=1714264 RepID=A0A1Q8Q1J7_9BACI|nr:hypothetical protein [Domibacillus antri]OLN21213.1 hypothetical protein BTO30_16165 [Domibacillus antri]
MSYNGSEKEFLVTLSLGRERILEKELGLGLENIQFEKHYPGLKIDMYAHECSLGTEVFVENLLLKSNNPHQEKVLKIIEMIEGGIIVYIASAFHDKHVKELQDAVKKSGKSITLYFAELNPNIFIPLQKLNRMHKLKVFENLKLLNIENPIRFLEKESIIQPIVATRLEQQENISDLESRRKKDNEFLLKTLRSRIQYFMPFHREKAHLQKLRIISFGAGRSDCNYYVSLSDRRNIAFVELRFSDRNSKIYNSIKEKESIVQERFNGTIQFKDNCISVKCKPSEYIEDTVEKLVDIFEKMIIAFSNYTYYFYQNNQEMWQYHQQGI